MPLKALSSTPTRPGLYSHKASERIAALILDLELASDSIRQVETRNIRGFAYAIVLTFVFASCSSTRNTGLPIEESGFLADYSLLSTTDSQIPGDTGPKARYLYVNPDADWTAYDKAIIDPVVFFASEDVEVPTEVQALVDYFWAEIREELKHDYELVESSQPGTLQITIALTRAGERNVTMDTVSTWVPFSRALAEIQGIFGKPIGVGFAKAEFRIKDAETSALLAATMDKRVGGKTLKDFDSWSDVRAAVDFWARLVVYRLCLLREETDCTLPKA